jgi:hypothetical protein
MTDEQGALDLGRLAFANPAWVLLPVPLTVPDCALRSA